MKLSTDILAALLILSFGLGVAFMALITITILPPAIPRCDYALDAIIGNGEYDAQSGYWSEYDCVSESAFSDHGTANRKSGMQP